MPIRLQTARGTDISNDQWTEISTYERNWAATLATPHRQIRTALSPTYNCHGLTFASRRTRVFDTPEVQLILGDDSYTEVPIETVLPGDVIVYYADDGQITHSGIVVANPDQIPRTPVIVSKWGSGPEIVHRYSDVHTMYRGIPKFYRCRA